MHFYGKAWTLFLLFVNLKQERQRSQGYEMASYREVVKLSQVSPLGNNWRESESRHAGADKDPGHFRELRCDRQEKQKLQ